MRSRPIASRWMAGAVASAMLVPAGCAQAPPPSLDLHLALQRRGIAVAAASFPVVDAVELFAKSRAAGALAGAGQGVVAGLAMLGSGSCHGEVCGAVLLLGLAVAVVVGGTVGAVSGALQATTREEAERIEEMLEQSVHELPAHLDLERRVVEAASAQAHGVRLERIPEPGGTDGDAGFAPLRARGFGHVLEVGVRRIEFGGGRGQDPELALEIEAWARLVEAGTGAVAYERVFRRTGVPQRFSAWARDGGREMREALSQGLEVLAGDIVSLLLVQADLGLCSGSWAFPGTRRYGACWLTPRFPPNEYRSSSQELAYPAVASLQPTFEWDPFPDERQRARLRRGGRSGIRDVRYELRLWDVRREDRGDLVYERRGLTAPTHRLEQALRPGRRYFWSVRACFVVEEGIACTPWASSLVPARGGRTCESSGIPPWNHFRFATGGA